jgi:hypothetical protein
MREFVSLLGMLKIVRVTRISKIIANLNAGTELKATYKVVNLVFQLFLYIHVIACLFYYVVVFNEEKWIPPLDFIHSKTDIYGDDSSLTKKYLKLLYHSVMIFGGIEVAPRTEFEVSL